VFSLTLSGRKKLKRHKLGYFWQIIKVKHVGSLESTSLTLSGRKNEKTQIWLVLSNY